jgi:hypothetical protein
MEILLIALFVIAVVVVLAIALGKRVTDQRANVAHLEARTT